MTTKWTPGPWHTDSAGFIYSEDRKIGKSEVAQTGLGSDGNGRVGIMLSNARLIAAAPEMAELLAEAVVTIELLERSCEDPHLDGINHAKPIKALLARINGETKGA
jgi:hypothetical protein